MSRPRVRNPPGRWHLSSPTGGPGGWLPSPRRGQRDAVEAGCPALAGRGSSGCGFGVLSAADPGQEAPGRTDKQTPTALDSLPGPANSHSAGAAERKARRRRLTRAAAGPARSRSGGRGPGAPRPGTPGCLLRGAMIPGPEARGVGGGSRSREAVAERAQRPLRDRDGDAGSSASERRRAGGRDRERQRAGPARSGLQPREAPPTCRPSPPARRTTPRTGKKTRAAEGRHLLSRRMGWGGVGGWGGGTLGQVLPRPPPLRVG